MRNDLLFHITTKEDWKLHNKNGSYQPESLENQGFIHCSTGSQVEETANRHFAGKDEIFLLVIDAMMLREEIKYEEDEELGEKFPHLYCPLSTNAIIDKIPVKAEENGSFEIAFSIT